jgi:hypothetical protein
VSWFLSVPVNVGIKLHCDFVVCSVYVYICFSHMNYYCACAYGLMLAIKTYYLGCIKKVS